MSYVANKVLLRKTRFDIINKVNIVFFEVKDDKNKKLHEKFPAATFVPQILEPSNGINYKDAEIICVDTSLINDKSLAEMPNLKFIATRSTGYDHIDLEYCKSRNITVSNVPSYGSETVAEQTFALLLTLTRRMFEDITQVKNLDFDTSNLTGIDLEGKTFGIVGLGNIGEHTMRIALGFGMNVKVFSRHEDTELLSKYKFGYLDLDNLLSTSDFVSLHVPATPETHHLINMENVGKFKKGSYLINTARGSVVETQAIIKGLDDGILEGVGLDVLEDEDNFKKMLSGKDYENSEILELNKKLINHPKVIVTPHNAFNTTEALDRIDETTIENIEGFLNANPVNLIS